MKTLTTKPYLKNILGLILIILILFSCCNENVDQETQQKIDSALKESEEEKKRRESLETIASNSVLLEVEIPQEIELKDEITPLKFYSDGLKGLMDGKFIKGARRYDLTKVIGHTAKLVSKNENTETYKVNIFNYLSDSAKPKIISPGADGLLSEIKITNKMKASLNFFIGDASLENEEIYHATVSETSYVAIDEKEIDFEKMKKEFPTKESRKGIELITEITVTEIMHKKYKKRDKKIKVKEFPIIGSGVSLGTEFYTETSSLKRSFKIGISTEPIVDILSRVDN